MSNDKDIVKAHKHSSYNKEELEKSNKCYCFYCLNSFEPGAIKEWIAKEKTALCPLCGIDSVLGDASGLPITDLFLEKMHEYWFYFCD